MTATVLAEGQHQRVTAAQMNMAFGQKDTRAAPVLGRCPRLR